jgi:signal transduction histidine kinase
VTSVGATPAQPPGAGDVLILAPTRGDAVLCRRYLAEAGLDARVCEDPAALGAALDSSPGALVVTEEALHGPAGEQIRAALARQEEWSALPLIVLTRALPRASLRILDDYEVYGRVTLLERPVRMASFVSAVRMALTERRQQCRIRDLLEERAESICRRDEFLALLGHELRNPLAAVMTCSDVLDIAPPNGPEAERCRAVIRDQARQIKRLLDDLMDVSRIARRKLLVRREAVDLRHILDEVVAQVRRPIEQKAQALALDLEADPIPLSGDPVRLNQVFANLLTNASRYSPEGGRIDLSARRKDGLAVVSVRDQGVGMTAETLAKIFEPFYQAGDRGDGSAGGLGVGLSLARSLTEMHAGTITASSEGPGRGSEFRVTLPLAAGPAAAPHTPEEPSARPAAPRRILLIEDNQEYGAGLRTLLEDRGHQVWLAHDGPEGIRAAERHRPEVVLLDIGLPGLDGHEVARRLRRLPGLSDVHLVAVSGFGREQDLRRSRRAGIHRHLVKPIALNELEAVIAEG